MASVCLNPPNNLTSIPSQASYPICSMSHNSLRLLYRTRDCNVTSRKISSRHPYISPQGGKLAFFPHCTMELRSEKTFQDEATGPSGGDSECQVSPKAIRGGGNHKIGIYLKSFRTSHFTLLIAAAMAACSPCWLEMLGAKFGGRVPGQLLSGPAEQVTAIARGTVVILMMLIIIIIYCLSKKSSLFQGLEDCKAFGCRRALCFAAGSALQLLVEKWYTTIFRKTRKRAYNKMLQHLNRPQNV